MLAVVKIMSKVKMLSMSLAANVVTERTLQASWDCPQIVAALGAFQDRTSLYLVLDFCEGGDLFHYLARCSRAAGGEWGGATPDRACARLSPPPLPLSVRRPALQPRRLPILRRRGAARAGVHPRGGLHLQGPQAGGARRRRRRRSPAALICPAPPLPAPVCRTF